MGYVWFELVSKIGPVFRLSHFLLLSYDPVKKKWDCAFDDSGFFEDKSMFVEIGDALSANDGYEVLYVGSTPVHVPESQQFYVEEALREINCFPVWLDREVAHRFYQGYCKTILWPVFHNILDVYGKSVSRMENFHVEETTNSSQQSGSCE